MPDVFILLLFLLHHTPGAASDHAEPAGDSRFRDQVAAAYDTSRGGFVSKDGLPSESAVELGFALAREGSAEWLFRAIETVNWTRGLRDTVGGGFVHRARDADPGTVHFEKRTDSNSRRLHALILAWQATGDAKYRRDAEKIVDFFDRVLLDGRGGFVAGQVGDRELVPEANGYAIHAWVSWAAATGEPMRRDFALLSLDRVWATCWNPGIGMLRRGVFGELLSLPQLVDQSEMGRAYVLGARIGRRAQDRERAIAIGDQLLDKFEEKEKGGFRTQAAPTRDGKGVKKAARLPEENARAARFLCELSQLTGNGKYAAAARKALGAVVKPDRDLGLDAADWALALRSSRGLDVTTSVAWKSPPPKMKPGPRSVTFKTGRR